MEITDEYLRAQRDRPAVLKTQLSQIRSKEDCALVFVVEGKDDLKVYDVWLRRVAADLKWEPLMAKGKRNAVSFRQMLERDTTGLQICTYFIVDHDYDGLAGGPAPDVYVLPAHSVENVLTDTSVVESLLRTEFQLLGDQSARSRVIEAYDSAKAEFCAHMRPLCETLHATKFDAVGNVVIKENCMEMLSLSIGSVVVSDPAGLVGLVTTEQRLAQSALDAATQFFDANQHENWVRGKYVLAFFRAWITALAADRRAIRPAYFSESLPSMSLSGETFEPVALAARSSIPPGLTDFVARSKADCDEKCAEAA